LAGGANINNLRNEHLNNLLVPLPPLPEQKRIAAILDKADAIRRKRRESLRLLDDLLRSTFLAMFGDPGTNPKGWPMEHLGETGSLERGISRHRPRNARELLGGPHALIQTGDVSGAGVYIKKHRQTYSDAGLQQSRMWPTDTLCITIAANIADAAILAFNACFPDSVVGFIPKRAVIVAEYVLFWMKRMKNLISESAPQVAQKNINLEILRRQRIPVAPIGLQRTFAEIVKNTCKSQAACSRACDATDELFHSALHGTFGREVERYE
jgi:type I restriction enzyme S subunit